MKVINTYIIDDGYEKCFRPLYETDKGYWFTTWHVVGQLIQVSEDEAKYLIETSEKKFIP